jgi:hypothetical protein
MRSIWVMPLLVLFGCSSGLMTTGPRSTVVSPPGNTTLSISGFVNNIQLNTAVSLSTTVTFIPQTPQAGPVATMTFCGDVVNGFVLNTFTTVNFTQGQGCSNVVSMVPNPTMSVTGIVVINQLVADSSPAQTLVGFAPQNSAMINVTFCGNVTKQFTINRPATVHFIQGQTCATIVSPSTA